MALVDLLNDQSNFSTGVTSQYSAPDGSKNITWNSKNDSQMGWAANFHLTDRIEWFGDDSGGTGHEPTFLSGNNWSGKKGSGGAAVVDFMLRGGDIENLNRRTQDVKRITKFLFNSPQGTHFLIRQGALQLLNPQSNTRIFNAGVNLLSQIAAAGVSNIRRDGVVPSVMDGLGIGDAIGGLLGDKAKGFVSKMTGGGYIDLIGESSTREIRRGTGDPGAGEDKNFLNKVIDISGLGGVLGGNQKKNYQTTEPKKRDKVNYLSIFEVGSKGLSEAAAKYPDALIANDDFVPFRFEIIDSADPTKSYWIVFRAFLDSLQDNYSASHNEIKYNGRGEKFYTYNAFDRKISLGFKIAAQTRDEMKPLYQKLNFLVSQTAPNYSNTGRIRTPYMRLTLGDYFNRIPGMVNNINVSWNTNYPWEVKADKGKDTDMMILPHMLDVQMNFQPIHPFTPNNSTRDSGNLTPFIGIDGGITETNDWTVSAIKNWTEKDVPPETTDEEKEDKNNEDGWSYYKVQSGENGGDLIKKFGCTKEEFCTWNNLNIATWVENSGGLQAGQEVKYKTTQ